MLLKQLSEIENYSNIDILSSKLIQCKSKSWKFFINNQSFCIIFCSTKLSSSSIQLDPCWWVNSDKFLHTFSCNLFQWPPAQNYSLYATFVQNYFASEMITKCCQIKCQKLKRTLTLIFLFSRASQSNANQNLGIFSSTFILCIISCYTMLSSLSIQLDQN